MTQHDLLPQEVRAMLPPLYTQSSVKDPMVYTKLLTPRSTHTFFITEFDGQDTLFGYTLVNGEGELGYSSLQELTETTLPVSITEYSDTGKARYTVNVPAVERDTAFIPKRLSEALEEHQRRHN